MMSCGCCAALSFFSFNYERRLLFNWKEVAKKWTENKNSPKQCCVPKKMTIFLFAPSLTFRMSHAQAKPHHHRSNNYIIESVHTASQVCCLLFLFLMWCGSVHTHRARTYTQYTHIDRQTDRAIVCFRLHSSVWMCSHGRVAIFIVVSKTKL